MVEFSGVRNISVKGEAQYNTWHLGCWSSITTIAECQTLVAIPYVDALLANIKSRFTDKAVKVVTAMSIFNPAYYPLRISYHLTATSKSRYLQSSMEKKQRFSMMG